MSEYLSRSLSIRWEEPPCLGVLAVLELALLLFKLRSVKPRLGLGSREYELTLLLLYWLSSSLRDSEPKATLWN